FSKAELPPLYSLQIRPDGLPQPPEEFFPPEGNMTLVEIPPDFNAIKEADFALARDWRFFTREVFETAFEAGYIVTDFVYDHGRSLYVLSQGESTLLTK